jgi:uncharacterized membrane protein YphA (DoxX/SURF4 family)
MRWIVGCLLVIAAVLKAAQLIVDPTGAIAGPFGSSLLAAHIGIELGLGLLVLSGMFWRQVRWAAILLFAMFAVHSLSRALSGNASCGCFGPIDLSPWWTFALDVAIVAGLLVSVSCGAPAANASPTSLVWNRHRGVIVAVCLGMAALAIALAGRYTTTRTATADDVISSAGKLVVLEPEKWIGKPLPIADAIDVDFSEGRWIVVLYRLGCHECEEAVLQYEALAGDGAMRVALVETPPHVATIADADGVCIRARLSAERDWFVRTPVEIQLQDGVVTSASGKLPALSAER